MSSGSLGENAVRYPHRKDFVLGFFHERIQSVIVFSLGQNRIVPPCPFDHPFPEVQKSSPGETINSIGPDSTSPVLAGAVPEA